MLRITLLISIYSQIAFSQDIPDNKDLSSLKSESIFVIPGANIKCHSGEPAGIDYANKVCIGNGDVINDDTAKSHIFYFNRSKKNNLWSITKNKDDGFTLFIKPSTCILSNIEQSAGGSFPLDLAFKFIQRNKSSKNCAFSWLYVPDIKLPYINYPAFFKAGITIYSAKN
jgi:hypothetical protein